MNPDDKNKKNELADLYLEAQSKDPEIAAAAVQKIYELEKGDLQAHYFGDLPKGFADRMGIVFEENDVKVKPQGKNTLEEQVKTPLHKKTNVGKNTGKPHTKIYTPEFHNNMMNVLIPPMN